MSNDIISKAIDEGKPSAIAEHMIDWLRRECRKDDYAARIFQVEAVEECDEKESY